MQSLERLPKQRISVAKKTKEWGKANIEEIEGIINTDSYNGRSSRYRKQVNYDLYNGRLSRDDFEYVTSPHGLDADDFPAELQHYDIMSPKLNLLLGEEMKRPFNYRVISVGDDAVSLIAKKRVEMLTEILKTRIQLQLGVEVVGQEEAPKTPEEVERYLTYSYRDIREVTAQR